MKPAILFSAFIINLTLAACGGSSNDETNSTNVNSPNTTPVTSSIQGGTPNAPATMVMNKQHKILSNQFYNYFKYKGIKNEKVIIHVSLDYPLSDRRRSHCQSNSDRDTDISVYNSNDKRIILKCGEDLSLIIPEDGTYTFHFDYSAVGGAGYFNVTSVIKNSAITAPSGVLGTPSSPKPLNTSKNNPITSNTFLNYYKVTAKKNDSLILNVSLSHPLSDIQRGRCRGYPGTGSRPSRTNTQIHVYDPQYNRVDGMCGDKMTFSFPENGTYILHFDYPADQSAGSYVNAALIKK